METPKVEISKIEESLKFVGLRIEVRPAIGQDAQMFELEKALKVLKRKLEKDNVLRIIKERKYYIKPSQLEHTRINKIRRLNELKRRKNK